MVKTDVPENDSAREFLGLFLDCPVGAHTAYCIARHVRHDISKNAKTFYKIA